VPLWGRQIPYTMMKFGEQGWGVGPQQQQQQQQQQHLARVGQSSTYWQNLV
jgi:hypothetical protein